MKPKLLLCMGLLMWRTLAFATDYYVSSSTGNDANNGTQSTPWKTIDKVNSIMSTLVAGDRVLFKCGDIFFGQLVITVSGTSSSPIVFGSYGAGGKPLLYGSQGVLGWTASGSPNIWSASFQPDTVKTGLGNVFKDGVLVPMGRWPNFNPTDGGYSWCSKTYLDKTANTPPSVVGGTLVVRESNFWLTAHSIVSQTGKDFGIADNTVPQDDSAGYFVRNHINTLDQDGEWFYDTATKKLYMYGTSTPTGIAATVKEYVVLLKGSYVTIQDLSFTKSNKFTINIQGASTAHRNSNVITNCNFSYPGHTSVHVSYSYDLAVLNCDFQNAPVYHYDGFQTHNTTIKGCSFNNAGPVINKSLDCFVCGSVRAVGDTSDIVTNNVFDSSSYIHLLAPRLGTVTRNVFKNACLDLDDGGSVYMIKYNGQQSRFDSNYFYGTPAAASHYQWGRPKITPFYCNGLYFDDSSFNCKAKRNVFIDCYRAIKINHGLRHQILNNIFYHNTQGIANGMFNPDTLHFRNKALIFTGNMFVLKQKRDLVFQLEEADSSRFRALATYSYNRMLLPPKLTDSFISSYVKKGVMKGTDTSFTSLAGFYTLWNITDATSSQANYSVPDWISLDSAAILVKNESASAISYTLPLGIYEDTLHQQYSGSIPLDPYAANVLFLYRKRFAANPVPGTIQAEGYDFGANGVTYSDNTAGNSGGQYRLDDVDIATCGDTGGGYQLQSTVTGEWTEYTINVTQDGQYQVDIRTSTGTVSKFHLEVDGVDQTGSKTITNNGWGNWGYVTSTIPLTQGTHILRLYMESSGGWYNYINFTYLSPLPTAAVAVQVQDVPAGMSQGFAIFPNPAVGNTVNLRSALRSASDVKVVVFNAAGGAVYEKTYGSKSAGQLMLSLSLPGLPKGVYTVRLYTQEGVKTGKLVL